MSRPAVALVVAVAANGVIGAKGQLPWRLRSDLRKFRAITMGKPIVMGRKTFQSIGHPLDGRDNIVVTRRRDFAPAGVLVAGGLEEALATAEDRASLAGAGEICIIGGGEIFSETLPLAARLYVTEVNAEPDGDVLFPAISVSDWLETSREQLPFSEGDTAMAEHVVFERRRA